MRNEVELRQISQEAAIKGSQALSTLTGQPVHVDIVKAELRPIAELSKEISRESLVAGIYLPVSGDISGASLLVFPQEVALRLCDVLMKRSLGTTKRLFGLEESALKEVGNILAGNYLTVLANRLEITVVEHLPRISCDMYGAVVDQISAQLAQRIQRALVVEVKFGVEAIQITGHLILLLAVEALEAMAKALETSS